jgi:hypothetical protein
MSITTTLAETLGLPPGPWSRLRRTYRSSKSKTLHHYEWCLGRHKRWNSETVSEELDLVRISATKTCGNCGSHLERGDNLDREYERILRELETVADAARDAGYLLEGTISAYELTRSVGHVRYHQSQRIVRRTQLIKALTDLDAQCSGVWEPVSEVCIERFDALHETIARSVEAGETLLTQRLENDDRFGLRLALDHLRRTYQRERRLTDTSVSTPGVERMQSAAHAAWRELRLVVTEQPRLVEMVTTKTREKVTYTGDHNTVAWEYVPQTSVLDPSRFSNPREWARAETEAALQIAVTHWVAQFETDLQTLLARHREPAEVVYVPSYVDGQSDSHSDLEGFGKLLQLLPRIGVAHKTLVLTMSPLTAEWMQSRLPSIKRVAIADEANVAAARTALGYLDRMDPERAHNVALALLS